MEITQVRIILANEEKLRAIASVTVDNCLAIHDVKVIQGSAALFISMPSKKRKDGRYKDIVHPINAEAREVIERAVIAEYKKQLGSAANPASP